MSYTGEKVSDTWISENHPDNGVFRVYWKDAVDSYSGGATFNPEESNCKIHTDCSGHLRFEWYYKDGKRDGIRKEWFSGGFQGTNLYRISKFNNGKQISDKVYTFGGRKLFTSTYKNNSVVDSIFQSRKGYETKIFIAKSNNNLIKCY